MSFKEGETIELKKSLASLKDGLISISAILNKSGSGELWFGVRPDGKPAGLTINDKTLRDISQSIAAHIEPRIYPQIATETLKGKSCIKITFSGKERPYFAYGRAYMRVADEDRHLTAKELENLILVRNRGALRWDNEPCRISLKELNEELVKKAPPVIGARSGAQSGAQSSQILIALQKTALSMKEVMAILQLRSKTGSLKRSFSDLLAKDLIEYTIPEKPNSRLQKYRLTKKGRDLLEKQTKETGFDEK